MNARPPEPVVAGVSRHGGRQDDGVSLHSVGDRVVHAGDRHCLGCAPVGAGEGDAGRADRTLGRFAAREADGDVGCGLGLQAHGEGGGAALLGGDQPGDRRDENCRRRTGQAHEEIERFFASFKLLK